MSGNFNFLKNTNADLYKIICEAENLYRDEYFEQCIVQVRRFGEQLCKDLMLQNNIPVASFDEMIETLKDNSQGTIEEKEFIEDLYFIKKNGNKTVHSSAGGKNGMLALECLQRSFEIALNYCVYIQGENKNLLNLDFDTELLITGKKSKKSLKEKYEEEKAKQEKKPKKVKQFVKEKKEDFALNTGKKIEIKLSLFHKFMIFLFGISLFLIFVLIIGVAFFSK